MILQPYFLLRMLATVEIVQALRWLGPELGVLHVIPETSQELDCRLDNASIKVVLLKDGTKLFPDGKNISQSGQIFTLHNFRRHDEGVYLCRVEPPAEHPQDKKEYNIEVDPNSREDIWLRTVPQCLKGPLGHEDTVTITCNTRYKGGVKWFKIDQESGDAVEVVTESTHLSRDYNVNGIYEKNLTLILTNVTRKRDSGTYVCWKSNGRDNARNVSIQILVQDPMPPSLTVQQTQLHSEQAPNVNLSCTIAGSPRPEVTWFSDGKRQIGHCSGGQSIGCKTASQRYALTLVDHRKCRGNISSWDSILTVAGPFLGKQIGNFSCRASNRFGVRFGYVKGGETTVVPVTPMTITGPVSQQSSLYVLIIVGIILAVTITTVAAVLYRRKRLYGGFYILAMPPTPDYMKDLDSSRPLLQQTKQLPYEPKWEFPMDRLRIGHPLGSGHFGQVFVANALGMVDFKPRGRKTRYRLGWHGRAYLNNNHITKVAVKRLKENATHSEYRDLFSELKILIHVGQHENIVNLLGACTKGGESDLLVITEYCEHGNLLDFVRERRCVFEANWSSASPNPANRFSRTDLVTCALQVTRGMEFLSSRSCVHRDLAARNVLVDGNYTMKVADFGLARDIHADSQYVKTSTGLLPIKWTAIEALTHRVYTHQSDVWSFGILLWELFTLGGSPYKGVPLSELYQFLVDGNRMPKPCDCPDEIYQIMTDCWRQNPQDRPNFSGLQAQLRRILSQNPSKESHEYLLLAGDTASPSMSPDSRQPAEA